MYPNRLQVPSVKIGNGHIHVPSLAISTPSKLRIISDGFKNSDSGAVGSILHTPYPSANLDFPFSAIQSQEMGIPAGIDDY